MLTGVVDADVSAVVVVDEDPSADRSAGTG